MKHTLLATTALVALTGAAAAEVTISGSARMGFMSSEGSAAVAGNMSTYADGVKTAVATASTTADITARTLANVNAQQAYDTANTGLAAAFNAGGNFTSLAAKRIAIDTAYNELRDTAEELREATGTALVKDTTDARNRVRISFALSGETDSGISYGATMRADNAGIAGASTGGTGGSQYMSGAFGKLKMGDLGGADKDATGNIAGVGLTGLGDHNEVAYQGKSHNFGYEYSTAGLTIGYSQNTAVKTGSNSAIGIKWAGELGGAGLTVGLGTSKVGTATQDTVSLSMTTGGLTVKAVSSTNDNGPAGAAGTIAAQQVQSAAGAITTKYKLLTTTAANNDTDTTGISLSYSMDAMSVTAFTKTVSTTGVKDMDYSGLGFGYDMGGVTLKAGVVDNNDQQLVDFGVSFSF